MQKKLIALAVAAAFSAPAFADNSNVTVYGMLNADIENVQNDKAAGAKGANRVQTNASHFGVKGSEDLGDGLAAIWQLEAQFDLNGAGGNAFGNLTRNSNIGLKGNFGTVFLGNWDTPYKVTHNKTELFGNASAFTATSMIGRTGANTLATAVVAGVTTNTNVNYVTRQASDIQYWTPNLNGFEGRISYAPDSTQTTAVKKNKISMSGSYENDMAYAALGYENRPGQTQATVTDTATRLVGAFKFTDGQVGLAYERLAVGTAAATTSTQNNWELSGKYKFGNSNLGAAYVQNGNLGALASTGANMTTLRYGYNFSKRTEMYAAYATMKNQAAANYSLLGGTANTIGAVSAGTAGSKQSAFGLGLQHSF